MATFPQLVGQSEIATLAQTSSQVIAAWRERDSYFPKPVQTLSCGSIWLKSDIEEYLDERDRFKQSFSANPQRVKKV